METAEARLTPSTLRAARGKLRLSQAKLAKLAGLCRDTVAGFEQGRLIPNGDSIEAMRNVLAARGIKILPNGIIHDLRQSI